MTKARNMSRSNAMDSCFPHDGCRKCSCPILIIEDQKSIASLVEATINDRYGYATVVANTLAEAALAIKAETIHLAISDLNLPDAPHGEIVDLLSRNGISTIALTGAFGAELRETILKKGAIDYIPKNNPHAIEYAVEMANRIYKNHHTKVLVVDDSLSSRAVLKHILQRLQFEVITAGNGAEALALLVEHPDIQMALVDYEMPEMNGCELTYQLRKQLSKEKLSILGISGSTNDELSAQFLKSGANDFVRKPFSYEELLCRIGQNLEVLDLIRLNRKAAFSDFLTGLNNRRHFFQEGRNLFKKTDGQNGAVAAMIDVDHFKKVNDTYGHENGDRVLKNLASVLSKHFGDHLLARLGGEEFAIVIKNISLENACKLFEDFRADVAASPVDTGEQTISYTVSIGVTDQMGDSVDNFIKMADLNLYEAKTSGRNRVVTRHH